MSDLRPGGAEYVHITWHLSWVCLCARRRTSPRVISAKVPGNQQVLNVWLCHEVTSMNICTRSVGFLRQPVLFWRLHTLGVCPVSFDIMHEYDTYAISAISSAASAMDSLRGHAPEL